MLSWVTGPTFILGIFKGYENRKNNPVADAYLAYKFGAMSSIFSSLGAYAQSIKNRPYPPAGITMTSGAIAGCILAGTTYYIGNKLGESVPKEY